MIVLLSTVRVICYILCKRKTVQLYYAIGLQNTFIKYAIANHIARSKFPDEYSGVIFVQICQHLKKLLQKCKGVPIL